MLYQLPVISTIATYHGPAPCMEVACTSSINAASTIGITITIAPIVLNNGARFPNMVATANNLYRIANFQTGGLCLMPTTISLPLTIARYPSKTTHSR